MTGCFDCQFFCVEEPEEQICDRYKPFDPKREIRITNGDFMRSLTDDELVDELFDLFAAFYIVEWTKDNVLDWLRSERYK